ncbi:hypothetical protein ACU686_42105 [Yinghuangia aomiensis]
MIRQFEVLDRGPNKAPALALYIRRRGAQAQVDIVDLENNPDAPSNYRVADRWTVDLPGQPVRSRIPGVEPTGVFGEITTMTVTNGPDGRSRLNIEYSSFGSITHQHWRLDNIERGAPLRHVAGADLTERDRLNIARTHVDVHRITAEGGRTSWMHVIRPADVPVDKVLPVVYVAYPYYDLSQRKDYLPHMSELIRLGCAVAIHDIYGSGAERTLGPTLQQGQDARTRTRRHASRSVATSTTLKASTPSAKSDCSNPPGASPHNRPPAISPTSSPPSSPIVDARDSPTTAAPFAASMPMRYFRRTTRV